MEVWLEKQAHIFENSVEQMLLNGYLKTDSCVRLPRRACDYMGSDYRVYDYHTFPLKVFSSSLLGSEINW